MCALGLTMWIRYHRPVDVLYVVKNAVPHEGDDAERGLELDFDSETGAPSGAKVIGYYRNGWEIDLPRLAEIVAAHLSVDKHFLAEKIRSAVVEGKDDWPKSN